jgi:uncharacterized protein with HEPN domain
LVKSAIVTKLLVIGEAANRLSDEYKISHNNVPWKAFVGFRNVLIHEYFGIEWNIVWNTIKKDLPELKINLTKN